MVTATYEFEVRSKEIVLDCAPIVVVVSGSLSEATIMTYALLGTSPSKDTSLRLKRVVDATLLIAKQEVVERKLLIEERQSMVKVEHSGEITEFRVPKETK